MVPIFPFCQKSPTGTATQGEIESALGGTAI